MLISILKELTNEEILNKIIEYPINIYPASLFGVTPNNKHWSNESIDKFTYLIIENCNIFIFELISSIMSSNLCCLSVKLKYIKFNIFEYVNDALKMKESLECENEYNKLIYQPNNKITFKNFKNNILLNPLTVETEEAIHPQLNKSKIISNNIEMDSRLVYNNDTLFPFDTIFQKFCDIPSLPKPIIFLHMYPFISKYIIKDFSFSLKPGTVGIKQVKSKPELCWGKLSAIGCLPHLQALTSNICDLIVEDCSPREHDYSTTHCDRMVGTSNNIKISYTREQLFQFNSQNNLDSSTLEKLFKLRILRGGMIKTYPCYSQFLPTPLNTHNKNSHINILHNDNRVDNSRSHLKKNGISGQEIFTIIDNEGILHKTHEKYKENEKDTMINVPLETGKFIYDQLCLDLNDEQDPDRNTIRILSSKLSRQKQTISQKYSPTSVHKKSNNIHLTPLKDCEKILPSNSRFICPLAAKESGKKKSHHKKSRVGWNYLAKLSRHLTSSQSSISTESSLSTLSLPDNATKNKNRLSRAMQFKNFNDSPVIPFVNYLIPKRMINHPLLDRRTKRISDKILNSPELFKVPKVIKSDENQLRTTLTPLKPLVKKSNSFIVCDKLCQQNIVTIVNNTSTIKTRANLINHIFPSPSKCKVDYNATDLQNHSKEAFGRKINLTEIFAMQPSSS
ncbi:unnamed protein product [Gordionus sp. m RMFG-2023]